MLVEPPQKQEQSPSPSDEQPHLPAPPSEPKKNSNNPSSKRRSMVTIVQTPERETSNVNSEEVSVTSHPFSPDDHLPSALLLKPSSHQQQQNGKQPSLLQTKLQVVVSDLQHALDGLCDDCGLPGEVASRHKERLRSLSSIFTSVSSGENSTVTSPRPTQEDNNNSSGHGDDNTAPHRPSLCSSTSASEGKSSKRNSSSDRTLSPDGVSEETRPPSPIQELARELARDLTTEHSSALQSSVGDSFTFCNSSSLPSSDGNVHIHNANARRSSVGLDTAASLMAGATHAGKNSYDGGDIMLNGSPSTSSSNVSPVVGSSQVRNLSSSAAVPPVPVLSPAMMNMSSTSSTQRRSYVLTEGSATTTSTTTATGGGSSSSVGSSRDGSPTTPHPDGIPFEDSNSNNNMKSSSSPTGGGIGIIRSLQRQNSGSALFPLLGPPASKGGRSSSSPCHIPGAGSNNNDNDNDNSSKFSSEQKDRPASSSSSPSLGRGGAASADNSPLMNASNFNNVLSHHHHHQHHHHHHYPHSAGSSATLPPMEISPFLSAAAARQRMQQQQQQQQQQQSNGGTSSSGKRKALDLLIGTLLRCVAELSKLATDSAFYIDPASGVFSQGTSNTVTPMSTVVAAAALGEQQAQHQAGGDNDEESKTGARGPFSVTPKFVGIGEEEGEDKEGVTKDHKKTKHQQISTGKPAFDRKRLDSVFNNDHVGEIQATQHAQQLQYDDGTSMINQYAILYEIGHGAQAPVVLACDTDLSEYRAIKVIPRPRIKGSNLNSNLHRQSKRKLILMKREIAAMKKCRHKNLVCLHEVIDDPESDQLFLVMEYVTGGNSAVANTDCDGSFDRRYTPKTILRFGRRLCAALQYLHDRGVVHRDIKPENVLLREDGEPVLADFGICDVLGHVLDQQQRTVTGVTRSGSGSGQLAGHTDSSGVGREHSIDGSPGSMSHQPLSSSGSRQQTPQQPHLFPGAGHYQQNSAFKSPQDLGISDASVFDLSGGGGGGGASDPEAAARHPSMGQQSTTVVNHLLSNPSATDDASALVTPSALGTPVPGGGTSVDRLGGERLLVSPTNRRLPHFPNPAAATSAQKQQQARRRMSVQGTVAFSAPEQHLGYLDEEDKFACDIFSLGLTLYVLMYGRLPWPVIPVVAYMSNLEKCDVPFPPEWPAPCSSPRDSSASLAEEEGSGGGNREVEVEKAPLAEGEDPADDVEPPQELVALLKSMLIRDPEERAGIEQAREKFKELLEKMEKKVDGEAGQREQPRNATFPAFEKSMVFGDGEGDLADVFTQRRVSLSHAQ